MKFNSIQWHVNTAPDDHSRQFFFLVIHRLPAIFGTRLAALVYNQQRIAITGLLSATHVNICHHEMLFPDLSVSIAALHILDSSIAQMSTERTLHVIKSVNR
jgi:hypothetical protein